MFGVLKAFSRLDSLFTAAVMVPAVIFLIGTGIASQNGQASGADVKDAAVGAIEKFVGQYDPYVKSTGGVISAGSKNLVSSFIGCSSGKTPVYTNPAMTGRNGCVSASSLFSGGSKIKPYRAY